MDFSNERYVKLYTRETTTWRLLGWEGQAMLPTLLKLMDRSGLLEIGNRDPEDAIPAHFPGWPREVVLAGFRALIREGVIELTNGAIVWPKYLEGQEASSTPAQRQRAHRERRRDESRESSGKTIEVSRAVTDGHAASRLVTPILSDPIQAIPSLTKTSQEEKKQEPPKAPQGAFVASKPKPKRAGFNSTPTAEEQQVLDALNAAAGTHFRAATHELRAAIAAAGVDACLDVVAHLAGDPDWQSGGHQAKYLDPITPFRPSTLETRIAKARAWIAAGRPERLPVGTKPKTERDYSKGW